MNLPPVGTAIGVDVGGTKIAVGLVRLPEGDVLARRREPTAPERGGQAVLHDVIGLIRSLQEEAERLAAPPAAVGVAVAELVGKDGRVLSEATIRWKHLDLAREILEETSLSARVEADVRAAAVGEAKLGAGRGLDVFLYVTIGTGISASLVIEGRPFLGSRGLTGTFASGRMLFPASSGTLHVEPPLEQFVSGPAIADHMAGLRPGFTGTAEDVLALAERGDTFAVWVVESAGLAIGAALARLVNMLDPEAIVLGGGLGLAGGLFRRSIDEALRNYVWSELHAEIPLCSAALGVDAGWIGAACAALT